MRKNDFVLVALGLNESETKQSKEPTLKIYKEHFETPFISSTEHYYTRESCEFVRQNSITEYMKKVEQRLEEEKKRIRQYLNESTEEILLKKCEEVLIQKHLDMFYSEFNNLLNDGKINLALSSGSVPRGDTRRVVLPCP